MDLLDCICLRLMVEVVLKIVRKLNRYSRIQTFLRRSEIMIFLKFDNFFLKIIQISVTQHSTGLSLGNQVDSLPSAQHTEAVWGDQGAFRPAPIDRLD